MGTASGKVQSEAYNRVIEVATIKFAMSARRARELARADGFVSNGHLIELRWSIQCVCVRACVVARVGST